MRVTRKTRLRVRLENLLFAVLFLGAVGLAAYLTTRYDALLKGVFDTRDVAYYVLFTLTFLVLAVRRLDADRLQP